MATGGGGLYLVDSSVWIPVLRRSPAQAGLSQRVASLVASNAVATTGIIRLELLRGTRNVQDFERLRAMLNGLHQLPTTEDLWEAAGQLGVQMQLAGLSTQTTDLLIATVALRARVVLLHRDRDFDLIAQHTALQVESYL
jgi:predicted nucleic acid-binding protein